MSSPSKLKTLYYNNYIVIAHTSHKTEHFDGDHLSRLQFMVHFLRNSLLRGNLWTICWVSLELLQLIAAHLVMFQPLHQTAKLGARWRPKLTLVVVRHVIILPYIYIYIP